MKYWLYTGNSKNEAQSKAQAQADMINLNFENVFHVGDPWMGKPTRLTADPEIEGSIYYYGFSEPDERIQDNTEYDLEIEYSDDWFVIGEI